MNINIIHDQDINDYQEIFKHHDIPDNKLKDATMRKNLDELKTENLEYIDFNKLNTIYIVYL